jgi:hypothetical protein
MLNIFKQGAFTIDPNATPEQIARKRATIAALMPRFGQARYVGEGLGQLATGFAIGRQNKRLDATEAAGRKTAADALASIFGAGGGFTVTGSNGTPSGTWTPDPPPPKATEAHYGMPDVAKGGLSFGLPKADTGVARGGGDFGAAVMTPQEMLIEGATRRGLDPIDVATAISYETGGRFDPMISGPTTQWGTHRGLIQFGEPQAKQHGVDFSSPDAAWRSQLNPENGAVWSYLDKAGVKPGMGLPEVYSAINAGSVGRMNASDAHNGGAPGTVADKVAGMAPHRTKAAAFLGGTWTPSEGGAPSGGNVTMSAQNVGGVDVGAIYQALQNPWLSQDERAMLMGLLDQHRQDNDPLRRIQLEKAQLELEQMRNPAMEQPADLVERMLLMQASGLDPASPEGQHYLLTGKLPEAPEPGYTTMTADEVAALGLPPGAYQRGPKGEIKQIGGGGVNVSVSNNASEVGTIPQGYEMFTDPQTGARSLRPIPGGPEDMTAKDAIARSNALTATEVVTSAAARAREAARNRSVGGIFSGIAAMNPSSYNAELYRQVEVLKSNAKIENLTAMRAASPTGGALGAVSEKENEMLAAKAGALDPASPNFERDLDDYERTLLRIVHGKEAGDKIFEETRSGVPPTKPAVDGIPPGIDPDDWKYMSEEERALFR